MQGKTGVVVGLYGHSRARYVQHGGKAAPPPELLVQFVPCAAVTGHCLLPAVPAALCRGQHRVPGLLAAFCAPDAPTGPWTLLLGDDVAEEVGV